MKAAICDFNFGLSYMGKSLFTVHMFAHACYPGLFDNKMTTKNA